MADHIIGHHHERAGGIDGRRSGGGVGERAGHGQVPDVHGDPSLRRHRHLDGDARDRLDLHPCVDQRLGLGAMAGMEPRVARVQPHHRSATPGGVEQHRHRGHPVGHPHHLGAGSELGCQVGDGSVGHHRRRAPQQRFGPQREQARIARPGADEEDRHVRAGLPAVEPGSDRRRYPWA